MIGLVFERLARQEVLDFMTTHILALACYCLGGLSNSLDCALDSDTLRDEVNAKSDLYDLVTGQFPHHGEAYYQERVRRTF